MCEVISPNIWTTASTRGEEEKSRNGKKDDDTGMSLSLMICHDIECNNEHVSDQRAGRESEESEISERILCQLNERNLSKKKKWRNEYQHGEERRINWIRQRRRRMRRCKLVTPCRRFDRMWSILGPWRTDLFLMTHKVTFISLVYVLLLGWLDYILSVCYVCRPCVSYSRVLRWA